MPDIGYLAEMANRGEKPIIRMSPTLSNTVIPSGRSFSGATRTPNDGDPPPAGDPPSDPPSPPAPPANQPADPPAGDPPKWKNGEVYDPAKADEALTASRNETNRLKRERDALEARIKAADDAQLSEQERLKKENEELKTARAQAEQTVRQQRVQIAVERAARQLEFVSEEAALRFLDQDQVTFGEDGQPQNVQALLEGVLKVNPYLKKAPTERPKQIPETPDGNGQTGMTPEQIKDAQDRAGRAFASNF